MTKLVSIQNCDQCPHRGKYDDWCTEANPRRELGNDKPRIPSWCPLPDVALDWIPVEERLPKPDNGKSAYLVIVTDGEVQCYDVLVYLEGDGWFGPGTGWHNEGDAWRVIQWMSLPPLPEEDTE